GARVRETVTRPSSEVNSAAPGSGVRDTGARAATSRRSPSGPSISDSTGGPAAGGRGGGPTPVRRPARERVVRADADRRGPRHAPPAGWTRPPGGPGCATRGPAPRPPAGPPAGRSSAIRPAARLRAAAAAGPPPSGPP